MKFFNILDIVITAKIGPGSKWLTGPGILAA